MIQGGRPSAGAGVGLGAACGAVVADGAGVVADRGADVGPGVGATVADTVDAGPTVGRGVTVGGAATAMAVSRTGVGRAPASEPVASPTAENRAPTADHARLPSSRMPTMPTIVAIKR